MSIIPCNKCIVFATCRQEYFKRLKKFGIKIIDGEEPEDGTFSHTFDHIRNCSIIWNHLLKSGLAEQKEAYLTGITKSALYGFIEIFRRGY
jgi:hypothetical protein